MTEPHGTMIRSNFTGMVLVKLRYGWVNLNNSVTRLDEELDMSEWTVTHRPMEVKENDLRELHHFEVEEENAALRAQIGLCSGSCRVPQ